MAEIATKLRYDDYVTYLEERGWRREQLTLDELNTNIVTTQAVAAGATGTWALEVRAPAGQKITMMGTQQVAAGADARTAHSLRIRLAGSSDVEIPAYTKIRITKEKSSEAVVQLARVFYIDVNVTKQLAASNAGAQQKTDLEWYRFKSGVELNGEQRLRIYPINNVTGNFAIPVANMKMAMDCDLWSREE